MNAELQTVLALAIVAITVALLIRRTWLKRKNPGCSSECGCPSTGLKARMKRKG